MTFLKCVCPQCGGHIEYPASGAGQTVPCPHCGTMEVLPEAVTPDQKKRGTLVLVGIVATGLLVIGLAGAAIHHQIESRKRSTSPLVAGPTMAPTPATEQEPPPAATAPKSPGDFKTGAIQFERKPGSGLVYAVGVVKNNSARQRFGVKIELNLLDSRGQKMGAATDYISVIEPRGDWSFRALINETKAVSATIDRISEQE